MVVSCSRMSSAIAFEREHAGLNGFLLYFMGGLVFLIDSRMLLLMVINSGCRPVLVAIPSAFGADRAFLFALLLLLRARHGGKSNCCAWL